MSGDVHLLVYYIREDGETIADSTSFSVAPCLDNNVSHGLARVQGPSLFIIVSAIGENTNIIRMYIYTELNIVTKLPEMLFSLFLAQLWRIFWWCHISSKKVKVNYNIEKSTAYDTGYYTYYISMSMYKFNKNLHPRIVNVLFQRNTEVHNVNTRQSRHLHVPFTRSSVYIVKQLDLKVFLYGTK